MTNYESRMRAKADALRARGSAVILSVESSCDETAVAVVENGRIERANAIATQIDVPRRCTAAWCRKSRRACMWRPSIRFWTRRLRQAGLTLDEIDAVAVTYGPGLVGALLTGVSWAKGLAYARGKAADSRQPHRGPCQRKLRGASGSGAALRVPRGLGRTQPHRAA